MPKGKGYKPMMKKSVGKVASKAKGYSIPSGKVSKPKKFSAKKYESMRTKVFGLAKKEDEGKA